MMQRKRYPKEFKDQLIQEVQEAGSVVQVAKRHGINDRTLSRWVRESKHASWEKAPDEAKKIQAYVPSPQEFRELEKENDQLKKILGEKDLKISILTDLLKKSNPGFRTNLK